MPTALVTYRSSGWAANKASEVVSTNDINSTVSRLQSRGYTIQSIVSQSSSPAYQRQLRENIPSIVQESPSSTTIYRAGTPIGKELEQPVEQQPTIPEIAPSQPSAIIQTIASPALRKSDLGKKIWTGDKLSTSDKGTNILVKAGVNLGTVPLIFTGPVTQGTGTPREMQSAPNWSQRMKKVTATKGEDVVSHTLSNLFLSFGERVQLAYNVYSGTGEKPEDIYKRNYEKWEKRFKEQDWGGIAGGIVESPLGVVGTTYLMGASLGGFAATKIGQTTAFTIKGLRITPALTLNTGIGTIFGAGMVKGGVESYTGGNIKSFIGTTALSLPFFLVPFKAGYKAGGGYVQRVSAMSTLSDATMRTQQKAIYDMMKTIEKLHEPYLNQKPYDITQIKETPAWQIVEMEKFFKSPVSTMIRKPAIGGSTAMDIQMGDFYRKGGYPERVLDIAIKRQSQTIQPSMRTKQPQVGGVPGDIDILLGGKFATTKMADVWSGKLDTHVHVSKPGTEYWGGYSTKPFTDSYVSFMGKPIKVKTLSIREQFLRYGHSVLPSNIAEKSYRAYKDVPGFYDTFDVLQFQKGGTKLNTAMDRFLNPSGYKSPGVTIVEKFIKGIGGATKISEDWSYGTSKLGYVPPYTVSPKISNLFYGTDGYTKPSYPSTPYKGIDYVPTYTSPYVPLTSISTYTSPYVPSTYTPPYTPTIKTDYGYTPTKATYTPPTYEPPYIPPSYTPTYTPPSYTPPYTFPSYIPPYKPPYKPPPYEPPYYPDETPPPPPPNKIKYPSIDMKKEIKESLGGYNVFIKERHYFKGKKKKPTTWFKASKHPLTKEQALSLGATAVDRSAAAAFKIVPTSGTPKKLGFGVDSWSNLSSSFYQKGNTLIEKTPYRINTSGEIEGISALGWLAQRQRPYQSPTKIRYTPTSNAKPMKPIQQINININKIMKGWKL